MTQPLPPEPSPSRAVPTLSSLMHADRMLRFNWAASRTRSPRGIPLLPADFVSCQGRKVRLIDVRSAEELVGPLGYIPGVDWVPAERTATLPDRLDREAPVVLISREYDRSGMAARLLERQGFHWSAALDGGMVAWNALGFSTSRDPSILQRCDQLRPLERPFSLSGQTLGKSQIEAHIGDPLTLRWLKLAALLLHARMSCVDGRDDRGIIGTPGGDAGEFLLALAALEDVSGTPLSDAGIAELLSRRVNTFGRFYMHSDVGALRKMVQSIRSDVRLRDGAPQGKNALEWRHFLAQPPVALRDVLLEHLLVPDHMGCGHVRLMLQNETEYGVRRELILAFLRAFYRLQWEGSFKVELERLGGSHDEAAVINVRLEDELLPFTVVPLIAPACQGSQLFVNHPQVSDYLRHQFAHFLVRQPDLVPLSAAGTSALISRIGTLAASQLTTTLGHLAKGLPVYDVTFGPTGRFTVAAASS